MRCEEVTVSRRPGVAGEAYHNNIGTDAHADGKNAVFQFTRQLIALRRSSRALRQGDYAMPIVAPPSSSRAFARCCSG